MALIIPINISRHDSEAVIPSIAWNSCRKSPLIHLRRQISVIIQIQVRTYLPWEITYR